MSSYKVLGLMSGSSLDGLDIAYCEFSENKGEWDYTIHSCKTITYPSRWKLRLGKLHLQNAVTYLKTSAYFGIYLGQLIKKFVTEENINPDFVALHGHTVFHQPEDHFSSQVGDGAAAAAISQLPVISSLRSADTALGGEGAPIVPMGDKHLFANYKYCLNLGGIANISCKMKGEKLLGYDICPSNAVLNQLAQKLGFEYDEKGDNGREGNIDEELLEQLNDIWYYDKEPPKSLSMGLVKKVIEPVLKKSSSMTHDKLRTYYEHIALQISRSIEYIQQKPTAKQAEEKVLVTGGGAHNNFLIERIREHSPAPIHVPSEKIIDFKEALVIAFLGVLRMRQETNVLHSVTGAQADTINGSLHPPGPVTSV